MESPGTQLKRARLGRDIDLRELASITRIPRTSLVHLENDQFDELPAEVFVRGFLRNVARELKLDPDLMIESYEQHTGRLHRSALPEPETQTDDISAPPLLTNPQIVKQPKTSRGSRLPSFPSFDNVVEVVGSARPTYVIGSLLLLLGVALAVSVFTHGLDTPQLGDTAATTTLQADWGVKADGASSPWIANGQSDLAGATTLDLLQNDRKDVKPATSPQ